MIASHVCVQTFIDSHIKACTQAGWSTRLACTLILLEMIGVGPARSRTQVFEPTYVHMYTTNPAQGPLFCLNNYVSKAATRSHCRFTGPDLTSRNYEIGNGHQPDWPILYRIAHATHVPTGELAIRYFSECGAVLVAQMSARSKT